MSERFDLLASIANTIKDYREDELQQPTPGHVNRWIRQFDSSVQLGLLRELDHVLKWSYWSQSDVSEYFTSLIENRDLAGKDPCGFWRTVRVLDIQMEGRSQGDILKVFRKALAKRCKFRSGKGRQEPIAYIYLDDALFTGFRVGDDVSEWLKKDCPDQATVHVVVVATHSFGEWKCQERLRKEATEVGKDLDLKIWAAYRFENHKNRSKRSEVLWPAIVPDDEKLKTYMAEETNYPFEPRQPGGTLKNSIFSSEEGRQLLEEQFLLAGMRIRSFCQNPNKSMRPLGFGPFGLGFGSMIITYRNCPNTTPLALWWGDPDSPPAHPLSQWYPLVQRKTHKQESDLGVLNVF